MKVWILADDRAGNVNQLLGIAEALGHPYERKDIRYNKWIRLPNWLRGRTFIGLDSKYKKDLLSHFPDVVLSAGRRSFPIARAIKRLSKGKTKIVQLMNPLNGAKDADLIVLPLHDNYKGHAKNVIQVLGTPHRITEARLKKEKEKWAKKLGQFPKPRVALLVGGTTKGKEFTIEMGNALIQSVTALKPGSVITTTSRRTPKKIVELLQKKLPKNKFFYRFGDKAENPYFGLLAWADMIVVTGDSMSMCSECCGTNKPVYIFTPEGMVSEKHARFHKLLYKGGYAMDALKPGKIKPKYLNPAPDIAQKIQMLVHLN
ncbi:MAG: mitochondrial fission ELM1 family protein [Alphaproteobacteria bacterium]|nr:mitochondrial fission ELM1 family protein [Alphaproteobacteria bacterium]